MTFPSTYTAVDATTNHKRHEAAVLSTALSRAANSMGLSTLTIGALLNLQNSLAARVLTGDFQLRRSEAERWKRSAMLVELFEALRAKLPDDALMQQWVSSHNTALDDVPMGWMETPSGLEKLIAYVRSGVAPQ